MTGGAIWVNGQRRSDDEPHVSARDRGFTLGDGLFETMRARHGTVFRLDQHLARLRQGLVTLEIGVPPMLSEWVSGPVGDAAGSEASVRLTVTRGVGAPGLAPPLAASPTVVVAVNPMPDYPTAIYTSGLTAHVASGRRNEYALTAGLKTIAYTDSVAAWLEARRHGADEALFLDTEGHCSEAMASNVFAHVDGVLLTPPLSCGALPGITRSVVLALAPSLGILAAERAFGLAELRRADEVFLTSSTRGIAPIVGVGGSPIGSGRPGPIALRLRDAHAALVARECGT
jgi:branched-chain amino acid aminotransferase